MYNFSSVFNDYYSRHLPIKEIGIEGQNKLYNAKVAIAGVGGLGSAALHFMALSGVGSITIIDQDTVEESNLHRQFFTTMDDIHIPKVEAIRKNLKKVNPDIKINALAENINERNVSEMVKGVDCVVDGLDNTTTRFLINRECVKQRIPYIFAGAIGYHGNVTVIDSPNTPCLECIMPELNGENTPDCSITGILNVTTGILGSIEAMETIKIILGLDSVLKGKILFCDVKNMAFNFYPIFKKKKCATCSFSSIFKNQSGKLTWLCGSDTVNINPETNLKIEFDDVKKEIEKCYKIIKISNLAISFEDKKNMKITLFKNGRMLIKNIDEKKAYEKYTELIKKLKIKC